MPRAGRRADIASSEVVSSCMEADPFGYRRSAGGPREHGGPKGGSVGPSVPNLPGRATTNVGLDRQVFLVIERPSCLGVWRAEMRLDPETPCMGICDHNLVLCSRYE
jgi:hypothetical protein